MGFGRWMSRSWSSAVKKKPPFSPIFEVLEHRVAERDDELEVVRAPPACEQREYAVGEARVVVEIAVEPRPAVLVRGVEPACVPHRAANERHRALGGGDELPIAENASRCRHALDHQPVPRGEDLVVASRADPARAGFEELAQRAVDPFLDLGFGGARVAGHVGGFAERVQVPVGAFEVGGRGRVRTGARAPRIPPPSPARAPPPGSRRRTCLPRPRSPRRAWSSSPFG